MPRPNQPRSIASESALARRIEHERTARGMSYEALAIQMKHTGCPINASALYRIEKGDPPRRITVDELVAFAQVFRVSTENLLLPAEVAASQELAGLVVAWNSAREEASTAKGHEAEAWARLREFVDAHPEATDALESFMRTWVEHYFEEEKREGALAMWMHDLTGAQEWSVRVDDYLNDRRAARRSEGV